MADKLQVNDPRVKYASLEVRGKSYGYIQGEPTDVKHIGTMLLIHGFPDLSFGWRYQIPHLLALGYRIIAPDVLGYGRTDAPGDVTAYTTHSVADDIAALARSLLDPDEKCIVGGHDMGGETAWTLARRHPQLISAVFSVCTPILEVGDKYTPLEDMIAAGKWTHFGYQVQFKGPDVQQRLQGADGVRQFLSAVYGATTATGEYGISIKTGVRFDILPNIGTSPLLSADELDFYVQQYMLHEAPQLRGPLNWYRVAELNWCEARQLQDAGKKIEMPALFIAAQGDAAVPSSLSEGMGKIVTDLTIEMVNAGHFVLWQAPEAINEILGAWLAKVNGN